MIACPPKFGSTFLLLGGILRSIGGNFQPSGDSCPFRVYYLSGKATPGAQRDSQSDVWVVSYPSGSFLESPALVY